MGGFFIKSTFFLQVLFWIGLAVTVACGVYLLAKFLAGKFTCKSSSEKFREAKYNAYSARFKKIRSIVIEWNPLGIIGPPLVEEDIDYLTDKIISQLEKNTDEKVLKSFLRDDWLDSLGMYSKPERVDLFEQEIEIYAARFIEAFIQVKQDLKEKNLQGKNSKTKGLMLEELYWQVNFSDDAKFLRGIGTFFNQRACLYLESTSIKPVVKHFLATKQVENHPKIYSGTLFPRPNTFHLPVEKEILEQLATFAEEFEMGWICDHLIIYQGEDVLLSGYDISDRMVYLSECFSLEQIKEFASLVEGEWRRFEGF